MSSLQELRIALAKGLGGYEDRGPRSPTGGRLTTAAGTTASLVEGRWPIMRRRIESDFYSGAFCYRTGVGAGGGFGPDDRVRQIGADGYDGQAGKLIPDTDWVTAPALGEEYELHLHGFDPYQTLTDFINETLRAIVLVVDVEMTLATDARGAYVPTVDADGLPLASWLKAPEQVLALRSSAAPWPALTVNAPASWPLAMRGNAWNAAGHLYLTASGAFWPTSHVWAQCYKPAYYHCRASAAGTFGDTAGLVPGVEVGEAAPETNWVAVGATALAWESFDDQERSAQLTKSQQLGAAKAAFYGWQRDYFLSHPVDRSFVPYGRIA